jgi:8-oxo-dGTP diphosphatase
LAFPTPIKIGKTFISLVFTNSILEFVSLISPPMQELKDMIHQTFGNKVRIRVCGLCIEEEKVLLIKHKGLGKKGILWAPPGGGIEFTESAESSIIREFREETGLEIEVQKFLFIYEYIEAPLHTIELFFLVTSKGGSLRKGYDPEISDHDQILEEIKFYPITEILRSEVDLFHGIFRIIQDPLELINLNGYYKYENSMSKGTNFDK